MALFTDGPINGASDLQNYESAILDVASTEGIDVSGKGALAQNEIATELTLLFRRRFQVPNFQWAITIARTIGTDDVVVTDPLKQWHAYKTLALIYRDAYNNQLNDRYKGKWQTYEQLAKDSSRNYFQIGVGLVTDPIPKATAPLLSTVVGTGGGGVYYVAATWQDQSGQQGSSSDTSQITVAAGQQLVVAVGTTPGNVTAWNVCIGTTPETITLQNTIAIALGATWTMTAGLIAGVRPGTGQLPTWFLADERVLERG